MRQTSPAIAVGDPACDRIGARLVAAGLVHTDILNHALTLKAAWGSRLGETLLALGRIDEAALTPVLAAQSGTLLLDAPSMPIPKDTADLDEALFYARSLVLPWAMEGTRTIYGAVDPAAARSALGARLGLCERLAAERLVIGLVTKTDLLQAVDSRFGALFGVAARDALHHAQPQYSARAGLTREQRPVVAGALAAFSLGLIVAPMTSLTALGVVGAFVFSAALAARCAIATAGLIMPAPSAPALGRSTADLPVYTILVPLYQEVAAVPGLIAALRALDYPAAKLDIKLIVEAHDHETRAAILAQRPPAIFEIVTVPPVGPQTKPKACNYALHYARGEFIVIFDAEDRPDPAQLRRAVAAFRAGPADLGCVQARLELLQRAGKPAHPAIRDRISVLVRPAAAGHADFRPADPARRHVEPFSDRPSAPARRVGSL